MKLEACLPKILLLTAALGIAGPLPVPAATTSPQTPGAKNVAAPKPAPPAPEPKIPGMTIPRTNGGYLGLLVDEDGHFKLSFYDAKKKPAKVDVARATARWSVRYKAVDERTVLNPTADGTALTSPKIVRPPYIYRVYLSLFVEDNNEALESHVIDFRQ